LIASLSVIQEIPGSNPRLIKKIGRTKYVDLTGMTENLKKQEMMLSRWLPVPASVRNFQEMILTEPNG
jgi:hypothetical protein